MNRRVFLGLVCFFIASMTFGATTYYVDVNLGNDLNPGLSPGALAFKTIKRALLSAVSTDTISVAGGTYNMASGEVFPIAPTSGVKLIGESARTTMIDATGASSRVVTVTGASSTRIEGFTVTGGNDMAPVPPADSTGGGIFCGPGDNTTITRNIFFNNVVKGYNGMNVVANFPEGGNAFGGGLYISIDSSTVVTNNLFRYNSAIGGTGVSSVVGGTGGVAAGGGIYVANAPNSNVIDNTFYSNGVTGGTGGNSSGGGAGGTGGAALGAGGFTQDVVMEQHRPFQGGSRRACPA